MPTTAEGGLRLHLERTAKEIYCSNVWHHIITHAFVCSVNEYLPMSIIGNDLRYSHHPRHRTEDFRSKN